MEMEPDLASIYAAPKLDEPRLAYAKRLSERGDPRGEFIELQCARHASGGKQTTRERALLKEFGAQWAGPLDTILLKPGRQYRRGFLAEGRLKSKPEAGNLLGMPQWRLFERIDIEKAGGAEYDIVDFVAQMPALSVVQGMSMRLLHTLCRRQEAPPLREVELRSPYFPRDDMEPYRNAGTLTQLRRIDARRVHVHPDLFVELRELLGDRIEVLTRYDKTED